MRCPACRTNLTEQDAGGIAVDVCEGGCGGMWFDNRELERFDEPHEEAGIGLLDVKRDPAVRVDHSVRLSCPRCTDTVMMRHVFSAKQEVEIDECATCGGYWLDCGELRQIRSQFQTEAERKAAAAQYFQDVLGDRLARMHWNDLEKTAKVLRIVRMFRFICPTYYIPGKQDWGAF